MPYYSTQREIQRYLLSSSRLQLAFNAPERKTRNFHKMGCSQSTEAAAPVAHTAPGLSTTKTSLRLKNGENLSYIYMLVESGNAYSGFLVIKTTKSGFLWAHYPWIVSETPLS